MRLKKIQNTIVIMYAGSLLAETALSTVTDFIRKTKGRNKVFGVVVTAEVKEKWKSRLLLIGTRYQVSKVIDAFIKANKVQSNWSFDGKTKKSHPETLEALKKKGTPSGQTLLKGIPKAARVLFS